MAEELPERIGGKLYVLRVSFLFLLYKPDQRLFRDIWGFAAEAVSRSFDLRILVGAAMICQELCHPA